MPATERVRARRRVGTALTALLLVSMPVGAVAAAARSGGAAVVATPTTSEPAEAIETTEAPGTTAAPETTASEGSTPDSTLIGATPDDDDATALTWIAIVAGLALVGVAVWWMLRQRDRGGPVPRMDDDWPRESDVI